MIPFSGASSDQEAVGRYHRRKLIRSRQIGRQCLEIAIVYAEQRRLKPKRPFDLSRIVHLGQHVHVQCARQPLQFARLAVRQCGEDQQDALDDEALGRAAMERAIQKLPIKSRFVARATQEAVEA